MLAISNCPRCQRPVSLPADVDRAAMVRCPLCDAEYALSEAIPPELVPVSNVTAEQSAWTEAMVAESTGVEGVVEEEPENEAAAVVGRVPLGFAQIRTRPRIIWWRALLGYVVSALVGCLIGYYALALWLGPELKSRGFPILSYLPGITWLTTPPEKADNPKENPTSGKRASKATSTTDHGSWLYGRIGHGLQGWAQSCTIERIQRLSLIINQCPTFSMPIHAQNIQR